MKSSMTIIGRKNSIHAHIYDLPLFVFEEMKEFLSRSTGKPCLSLLPCFSESRNIKNIT
jgi:hypothetical protein